MSLQLYLGVRLPEQPYFRMPINDVDPGRRVSELKIDISKLLHKHELRLEFIYCGNALLDTQTLLELNVRDGSTIHVLQKAEIVEPIESDVCTCVTEAQIKAACSAYNKLKDFAKVNTDAVIPKALKIVMKEYPEFHTHLGALAIIRNKSLLTKLRKKEFGSKIAATYPILITAAEFIVRTYNEMLKNQKKDEPAAVPRPEEESDVSMESEDESSRSTATNPTRPANTAAISRNQLADALLIAGSSALQAARGQASSDLSTSSSANSRPSTSNSSSGNRITNSAFQNALQNAYRDAAYGSANTTEPVAVPSPGIPLEPTSREAEQFGAFLNQSRAQFVSELQIMREMGLMDDARNFQALVICNGDVERAINIVLSTAEDN